MKGMRGDANIGEDTDDEADEGTKTKKKRTIV